MNIDDNLNDAATWIVYGVGLASHLLVFIYGLGSPWWRSLLGVTIFAKWLSVAVVFDYLIARRVWGSFPGYGLAAIVVYGFMFLAFSAVVVEVVLERRRPSDEVTHHRKETLAMSDPSTPGVPAIWYKAQRVLRTIVAVGIPAFLAFALVLPQIIAALGLPVTSSLYLWLVAFAAIITAVAGGLTRVMAIPGVNAFLIKIGLGSVPKDAVMSDGSVAPPGAGIVQLTDGTRTTKLP